MIFSKLEVSGFKAIGEPIEITFPQEGKLGIFGNNESGKSTLLKSIEFALFGIPRGETVKEDIITWGKAKARVMLEFQCRDMNYRIERTLSKTSHDAVLKNLTLGKIVSNNLTEVNNEIEELVGVDRDSFEKLVFIKQKDLDALEGLAKKDREKMINKVMGIEVIDSCIEKLKDWIKESKNHKEAKLAEFALLKEIPTQIEQITIDIKGLNDQLPTFEKQRKEVEGKRSALEDREGLLVKLSKLDEKNKSLEEKDKTIRQIDKRITELKKNKQNLAEETKKLRDFGDFYSKNKDRYETINATKERFKKKVDELKEKDDVLSNLRSTEQKITKETGINVATSEDIDKKKSSSLKSVLVLIGITFVFGIATVLFFPSILIALGAGYYALQNWKNYNTWERVSKNSGELIRIKKNVEEAVKDVNRLNNELKKIKSESGFNDIKEIEKDLNKYITSLKEKTGETSFDGLASSIKSTKTTVKTLGDAIRELEHEDLEDKQKGLGTEIKTLNQQIVDLKKELGKAANLPYSEDELIKVKKEIDDSHTQEKQVRDTITKIKTGIQEKSSGLTKLQEELKKYKQIGTELQKIDEEFKVYDKTEETLRETGAMMREKVLPAAKFRISQMLPILTDNRYSKMEITDDLKTKVYSTKAGGIKEKDIFSGGTQDQFLIAMRIAFTQAILASRTGEEKFSLLMDESISSSDTYRREKIFEVLDLAKDTFQQIFVIAHEDISNNVNYYLRLGLNQDEHTKILSKSW